MYVQNYSSLKYYCTVNSTAYDLKVLNTVRIYQTYIVRVQSPSILSII